MLFDSRGDGSSLTFWVNQQQLEFRAPETGSFSIVADRAPIAVIEVKAVETDLGPKLSSAYTRGGVFRNEVLKILAHHWQSKLREADRQIADSRKLLRCEEARGVVVLIEKEPIGFDKAQAVIGGYLNEALRALTNVDAVVYLSNDRNGQPEPLRLTWRKPDDPVLLRFLRQFQLMVHDRKLEEDGVSVQGVQPDIVAQIDAGPDVISALRDDWQNATQSAKDQVQFNVIFTERSRFKSSLKNLGNRSQTP